MGTWTLREKRHAACAEMQAARLQCEPLFNFPQPMQLKGPFLCTGLIAFSKEI